MIKHDPWGLVIDYEATQSPHVIFIPGPHGTGSQPKLRCVAPSATKKLEPASKFSYQASRPSSGLLTACISTLLDSHNFAVCCAAIRLNILSTFFEKLCGGLDCVVTL